MRDKYHAEAMRRAQKQLAAVSDTPDLDAAYLMAKAANVQRSEVWRLDWNGEPVPSQAFGELVTRRMAGEPLAYILGDAEFFGRLFCITPDVLIPRSDSETLIYAAKEEKPEAARVLDMGTGSGALFVTALLELQGASGVAIDASSAALQVAEANAKAHGLSHGLDRRQASFACRDWTQPAWDEGLGQFDLVLCNPPYVEEDAALDRSVRDFEPAEALFAGPEGLDDYRVIIPQLGKLLMPQGIAILEIGSTQADAVRKIAENEGFSVKTRQDLANRSRAVILY